jgi:hypothetical protein
MRKLLSAAALVAALVSTALAGPARADDKKSTAPAGQYVDLSSVAMPIVTEGKVRNYVFVAVRVDLAPQADAQAWRDKEPYFRDALVRLGHRTPFTLAGDLQRLDEPALKRAMMAEAAKITGPRVVIGVEILRAAAQRRLTPPGPAR